MSGMILNGKYAHLSRKQYTYRSIIANQQKKTKDS